MLGLNVAKLKQLIAACDVARTVGKLRSARGVLTAAVPAAVGELCQVMTPQHEVVLAEVIGFEEDVAHILPFDRPDGLQVGSRVICLGRRLQVPVGPQLLGRVLNGLARPIDRRGPLAATRWRPVSLTAPQALERPKITEHFRTGQRAIDGLLTIGKGQRVGLFAGGGVGKSTLLGQIAKGSEADVNVIALIGERGREVRPFLEDSLGPEGIRRSVVVVATAEQPALMRIRAAQTAIAIANDLRQQGRHVLFMLDSLTRMATAQREIGLLLGEPPASRGFTPSVFQLLANTAEQLGRTNAGDITGILTILVDGDEMDEPVSDAVRALLDGHIVLDRQLAEKGHYPAIAVGASLSRVFRDVVDSNHLTAGRTLRTIMATYAEVADLIRIGAYSQGSSPEIDRAVSLMPHIERFLTQDVDTFSSFASTRQAMDQIAAAWNAGTRRAS